MMSARGAGPTWQCMRTVLSFAAFLLCSHLHAETLSDTVIEIDLMEPIWVTPVNAGSHECHAPVPGLLTLPPYWTAKDAAAIMISSSGNQQPMQERLLRAMLTDGAAVLEIELQHCGQPDIAHIATTLGPGPVDPLPTLFGAILTLRRDLGAGIVVAIGIGEDGNSILNAGGASGANRWPEQPGSGLAALVALGPGPPLFMLGSAPAVGEHWPSRAMALCTLLAKAVATPLGTDRVAAQDIKQSCLASLLSGSFDRDVP